MAQLGCQNRDPTLDNQGRGWAKRKDRKIVPKRAKVYEYKDIDKVTKVTKKGTMSHNYTKQK